MTYKTHVNFGILCSSLFIMYIYKERVDIFSFIFISSIMALIPDWDHNQSYITNKISPILCIMLIFIIIYEHKVYILFISLIWFIFAKFSKHRTFTHSILGMLIFSIPFYFTNYFIAVLIGYSSHIIADIVTKRGVLLLYPFNKKVISLRLINTNSIIESLLYYVLLVVNVYNLLKLI